MASLVSIPVFSTLPTIPPSIQLLCQAIILSVFIPFVIIMSICLTLFDIVNGIFYKEKNDTHKVILITGASSGIGEAIALEYAKPGVILGLLGRNEDRLNKVIHQCQDKGAECVMLKMDISDTKALTELLERFDDDHPIDLLFANAAQVGVTRDNSDNVEWEDAWKRLIEVNYMGNICTVMTAYKRMKQRKFVTSSIFGFFGPPNTCWYNSTKSALNSFARDLRYIAEPYNIRVSLITPGLIDSNMTASPQPLPFTASSLSSPNELAKVIKRQLESNIFCIAWPFSQMLLAWIGSTFPPRVLLMVSWAYGTFFQTHANNLALT